jgi:transcriptional regulator with XRE-family HTH domain
MTIGKKAKRALKGDFVMAKRRVILTPGDMLRILREKNNLTQSELADLASLTQATISSLEGNRIRLGVERSKTLARVLHVHPAVLLFPDWKMGEEAA